MKAFLGKIALIATLTAASIPLAVADSSNDVGKPSTATKAPTAATVILDNYTIDSSSPTQSPRLFRDGNASTCASPKSFPGTLSGTFSHVVSNAYSNPTGSPVCATVTLTTDAACVDDVFATAYLGSFNPADLSMNYLADSGNSLISPSTSESFEVQVPAYATIVFNFNATSDGGGNCTFSISSRELVAANVQPRPSREVLAEVEDESSGYRFRHGHGAQCATGSERRRSLRHAGRARVRADDRVSPVTRIEARAVPAVAG